VRDRALLATPVRSRHPKRGASWPLIPGRRGEWTTPFALAVDSERRGCLPVSGRRRESGGGRPEPAKCGPCSPERLGEIATEIGPADAVSWM
jgi:hypothetical protein